MGKASRDKGRRAQTEGRQLLEVAGWVTVDTSAGTDVEDVFAIDRAGDRWSVEVTADQGVSFATKWGQTSRQAHERGARPLMLWKIDRAGWWLIVDELDVEPARARALELELHPAGHVAVPTMVRQLAALRPADGDAHRGAMPVLCRTAHLIAPARQALARWWA